MLVVCHVVHFVGGMSTRQPLSPFSFQGAAGTSIGHEDGTKKGRPRESKDIAFG